MFQHFVSIIIFVLCVICISFINSVNALNFPYSTGYQSITSSRRAIYEATLNPNNQRLIHNRLFQYKPRNVQTLNVVRLFSKTDVTATIPNDSQPISQLQLQFNCDDIDADELSEMILELGPLSVSVEALGEKIDILNEEANWEDLQKTKSWATALIRANFPSSFNIKGVIDMIYEIYPGQVFGEIVEYVQDIDWVMEVQKNWKPQIIGDLVVKFPWHLNEEIDMTSINHQLILEGGSAFGTGDHPTTRLCCAWLKENINPSSNSICRVLDYGCGSAILGLAALRYGASEAVGVDIDKDALVSASNNCILNSLNMPLYVTFGGDDTVSDEEKSIVHNVLRGNAPGMKAFESEDAIENKSFDVTVANILAPILISLAPTLSSYTKSGGVIGLSGIVNKQAETVIKVYDEYFSDMKVENIEGDWVLITGKRR